MIGLKRHQSFPLRLSTSVRQLAHDLAQQEGISLNQFINLAVAEKISRLEHDSFLMQQKVTQPSVKSIASAGLPLRATG